MNKSTIKRAKQEMHKLGEGAAKKTYVSPRLVEYGNVAKLLLPAAPSFRLTVS